METLFCTKAATSSPRAAACADLGLGKAGQLLEDLLADAQAHGG